jgi:DNA helicase-2/ATP-dependent DNA helicase PcrA
MNNEVIFAAAGNGKTYNICQEAIRLAPKTDKYILLITYTNEGIRSLEKEYRKQNLGVIDKNVIIKTWYTFLLSELIKPYQCLLKLKHKHYKEELDFSVPENYINSIAFYQEEAAPRWYSGGHIQYYINSAKDLRKDNVSCLACKCIEHSNNRVIKRLESIYSHVFFDELQDYAGWDLEIFKYLFNADISVKCVGDNKQATFRTNNSSKNRQYRDEKIKEFFSLLQTAGICSLSYDNTTKRFNQEICDFVNMIHNDKISCICPCNSVTVSDIDNSGVFIIDNKYVDHYCKHYSPVILRYNRESKIGFNHNCSVFNYGNSKGATFNRIVIVPVSTVLPFICKQEKIVSNQTRSKFFVACTRAKHSIVFAVDNPKSNDFFKQQNIIVGGISIPTYKYSND